MGPRAVSQEAAPALLSCEGTDIQQVSGMEYSRVEWIGIDGVKRGRVGWDGIG
jgi:hypothetical protein